MCFSGFRGNDISAAKLDQAAAHATRRRSAYGQGLGPLRAKEKAGPAQTSTARDSGGFPLWSPPGNHPAAPGQGTSIEGDSRSPVACSLRDGTGSSGLLLRNLIVIAPIGRGLQ